MTISKRDKFQGDILETGKVIGPQSREILQQFVKKMSVRIFHWPSTMVYLFNDVRKYWPIRRPTRNKEIVIFEKNLSLIVVMLPNLDLS